MVGLENWIFRKSFLVDRKIVALTTKIHFRSYFHFKWFSKLGTRKGERESSQTRRQSWSTNRTVDREAPHRSRSREWCFARRRSRDRAVFFWVLSVFFWVLTLPSSFPNTKKIFQKIFWNATKHMKTFSFPEMLLHEPNTTLVLFGNLHSTKNLSFSNCNFYKFYQTFNHDFQNYFHILKSLFFKNTVFKTASLSKQALSP